MDTKMKMYKFMLEYQDEHGEPPLMKEIVEAIEELTHNSSVRHDMLLLVGDGLVEEEGADGAPRRYSAIGESDDN